MLLADRDPNGSGSGRTSQASRASDMSVASRGAPKGSTAAARAEHLSSAPGVASMLRVGTEMGNVSGLGTDSFGFPNMQRVPRRGGATSRLSTASSRSNASNRTSTHRPFPSVAPSATRRSRENNIPQYVPDTLSPTVAIPDSSPLIPRARESRVGHRSLSMTLANTSEPTFRLSSNRSLASLRSHEQPQRPKSPYMYPTRLRRSGYRPTSPALSDTGGPQPRRPNGLGNQGPLQPPLPLRRRAPSEMSILREERWHAMNGPPSRGRSPVFYGNPHPDIPPVPPLQPLRHFAAERSGRSQRSHRSASHRSGKASVSSGSTNRPVDSDTPSSDATLPPTPRDGGSMGVLASATGILMHNISGGVKEEMSSGPLYYDYTEHFEPQPTEVDVKTVPIGFVHRIKTIIEEHGTSDGTSKADAEGAVEKQAAYVPDVAELPASPVPRRITRDLVLAALEHASTTGDVETSGNAAGTTGRDLSIGMERATQTKVDTVLSQAAGTLQIEDAVKNRHSILSQAGSSVMDSSTLNFAVNYSIPMVAGNGITMRTDDDTRPVPSAECGPTTEDGMSDLLDGYQHTETQQDNEASGQEDAVEDDPIDKKSNHAAKSSDEQSFKSCTDLPEHPRHDEDVKSLKSSVELPGPEPVLRDSDAKSFKTCKDAVTPDCAASMPTSRLPSTNLASSESKLRRPFSEVRLPSPPATDRKHPPVSASESSISKVSSRLRGNPKLGSIQGSGATSISSTVDSSIQLPPAVPPRESSSSNEAQRSNAVANFLMKSLRPGRLVKSNSGLRRKPAKKGSSCQPGQLDGTDDIPGPPQMHERSVSGATATPAGQSSDAVEPLEVGYENVATGEEFQPNSECNENSMVQESSSANRQYIVRPTPRRHPGRLLLPSNPDASSVYLLEDISPKPRIQSSPVAFPETPENRHRDSQSTTQLSWDRHKSLNFPVGYGSGGKVAPVHFQEGTTTDLRIPPYSYRANYLPDLKESHDDSSLNTSASNLKRSSFRYGNGGLLDARASRMSADEAMFRRNSSVRSYRNTGLRQIQGLPSMNFSKTNLLDKFYDDLDFDLSRSLDPLPLDRREAFPGLQRPASASDVRGKYQSVFGGLDVAKTGYATGPTIADQLWFKRYQSPELLEALDKLTVPDVTSLTHRLSELMPSFKTRTGNSAEFAEENVIMEHALEEIHEVGGPAPKRSSARLRPLPGSPSMVVVDDALYEKLTSNGETSVANTIYGRGVRLEKGGLGEIGATKGRSWSVAHTRTRDTAVTAELNVPSPTALRTRSLSLGHPDWRPSSESRVSSVSPRSHANTPTAKVSDTMPWNFEKSSPWAATTPSVDISLPPPTGVKSSPRCGPSRLRNRLSHASTDQGTYSGDGTPSTPAEKMSIPGSDDNFTHARRQSIQRYSVFGHSLRSNNPPGFDASGNPLGPLYLRGEDQSHDPGERYPTSALALPLNVHLPDAVSRFSDYGSDGENEVEGSSSRKTRFGLKSRRSAKASSQREDTVGNQEGQQATNNKDAVLDSAADAPAKSKRQTFSNAKGMPKFDYYKQRVINEVKGWAEKSTNRIRKLFRPERKAEPGRIRSVLVEGEGRLLFDQSGEPISRVTIQ